MSYIGNPIVSTDFPVDYASGNGSTTAFTLSVAPASVNSIDVQISGVAQSPQTYTVSGTTLTFSAAPPSGTNNIVVRHLGVAGVPNTPSAASVVTTSIAANAVTPTKMANSGAEFGMRNRIINGDMRIDQRNAGAGVTPSANQYLVDRWQAATNVSSKFSVQQSTTAPAGFNYSMLVTSLSAYSIGASELCAVRQSIEGYNIADLGLGTASAKTFTVSFWVRSSLTGTFGGSLMNGGADYSYPFTYTISAANTWEQKTVTVAGATAGTWLTTNGIGLSILFGLGVGSTFSGTAGSWSANGYYGATGATSVVGTNGATFYITGVQIEVGSSATGYEYRQYGQELALCQRYYYTTGNGTNPDTNSAAFSGIVLAVNGSYARVGASFKQTMRAVPTVVLYDGNGVSGTSTQVGVADAIASTAQVISYTGFGQVFKNSGAFSTTAGYPIVGGFTASAEL